MRVVNITVHKTFIVVHESQYFQYFESIEREISVLCSTDMLRTKHLLPIAVQITRDLSLSLEGISVGKGGLWAIDKQGRDPTFVTVDCWDW